MFTESTLEQCFKNLITERNNYLDFIIYQVLSISNYIGGVSRAAATSKMEYFVIIVNVLQPLTIVIKHSILDVAAALHPPLGTKLF